jgi:acetyltransferase-like isoleucine patch superfamily enzyme
MIFPAPAVLIGHFFPGVIVTEDASLVAVRFFGIGEHSQAMAITKAEIRETYEKLRDELKRKFNRTVSFADYFTDRWERARYEGFGEGTSVYDNVLILGDVRVGQHTWIGPNVILDGRGGLVIGEYCSISAGVQIYTHHTVRWSTTLGAADIDHKPTRIGNGVYIGPGAIIQMGVTIGDRAVIGALSLVNRDIPDGAQASGAPARVVSIDSVLE